MEIIDKILVHWCFLNLRVALFLYEHGLLPEEFEESIVTVEGTFTALETEDKESL